MNHRQIALGQDNLAAVRAFFEAHLCATQRECASALGLSIMAVNRHTRAIRAEWRSAEGRKPDRASRRVARPAGAPSAREAKK